MIFYWFLVLQMSSDNDNKHQTNNPDDDSEDPHSYELKEA